MKPWAGLDEGAIINFYEEGNSLRKTGEKFGVAHSTVRNVLHRNNEQARRRGLGGCGSGKFRCGCDKCKAYARGYQAGRRSVERESMGYDETYGGLLP